MTNLIQAMCRLAGYRYALQPGDGVCYEFTIIDLESVSELVVPGKSGRVRLSAVIDGVSDGNNFISLIVHWPGQGCYEFSKSSLDNYSMRSRVAYAHEKMKGVDRLDLRKILAAASVLAENPEDLAKAIEAMVGVDMSFTP